VERILIVALVLGPGFIRGISVLKTMDAPVCRDDIDCRNAVVGKDAQ